MRRESWKHGKRLAAILLALVLVLSCVTDAVTYVGASESSTQVEALSSETVSTANGTETEKEAAKERESTEAPETQPAKERKESSSEKVTEEKTEAQRASTSESERQTAAKSEEKSASTEKPAVEEAASEKATSEQKEADSEGASDESAEKASEAKTEKKNAEEPESEKTSTEEDYVIYDVDGNVITDEYAAMLRTMKSEVEASSDTNIPITSWRRAEGKKTDAEISGDAERALAWSDINALSLGIDDENEVWDGSRLSESEQKEIEEKEDSKTISNDGTSGEKADKEKAGDSAETTENMVTAKDSTLYDSATWSASSEDSGESTLHRFRGAFTVSEAPEERTAYSYTLSSVTDDEKIYSSDAMLVFVYPQDVTLTDANYTDYLALWTTADTDAADAAADTSFGGVAETAAGKESASGLLKLTDGISLTAETDNVGEIIADSEANAFYVDVVVASEEDADGGLYRMQVERAAKAPNNMTIYFKKVEKGNTEKTLAGAKFKLVYAASGSEAGVATTYEDKKFTFNIPRNSNTYKLTETQAPSGYQLSEITWSVTVKSSSYGYGQTFTYTIKASDGSNVSGDGTSNNPFVIENTPTPTPDPGESSTTESQLPTMPAPAHSKYIAKDKGENEDYTLTLDVTGKMGDVDPIDILLIVDKSGSMSKYDNRYQSVNSAVNTLITSLKNAKTNAEINLSAVAFSGDNDSWTDVAWDDASVLKDWTELSEITTGSTDISRKNYLFNFSADSCKGGTNWQAGIKTGEAQFSGRTNKRYVIFLTDGAPTFRYNNNTGKTDGNGNSDPSDQNYNAAVKEWEKSTELQKAVGKYLVNATGSDNTTCNNMAAVMGGKCLDGNSETTMKQSFQTIADAITNPYYKDVTLSDTLSDYAEFAEYDNQGRPAITVYKETKSDDGNFTTTGSTKLSEGTADGSYTYTYDQATGKVSVTIHGQLEKDVKYWVEFKVKPTDTAYIDYAKDGYKQTDSSGNKTEVTGDEGTDADGNATSSGKAGFHSNAAATLTYSTTNYSTPQTTDYKHPVLQVSTHSEKVVKVWEGTPKDSVQVKLTATVNIDGESKTLQKAEAAAGADETRTDSRLPEKMTVTLNASADETKNWTYTFKDLLNYYAYEVTNDDGSKSTSYAKITYTIDEVDTPEGYDKKVVADKTDQEVSESGIRTTTITNTQLNTITIKKVDGDGNALKDAKFKLEKKNEAGTYETVKDPKGTGSYEITTDKDGLAKFENLKKGTYRITEIESPTGYNLLLNPIEVEMPYFVEKGSSEETGIKSSEGTKGVEKDDGTYYYDITYTIKNNRLFTMPEAGGGFRAERIGVAVMMLSGLAWIAVRRRRKMIP